VKLIILIKKAFIKIILRQGRKKIGLFNNFKVGSVTKRTRKNQFFSLDDSKTSFIRTLL